VAEGCTGVAVSKEGGTLFHDHIDRDYEVIQMCGQKHKEGNAHFCGYRLRVQAKSKKAYGPSDLTTNAASPDTPSMMGDCSIRNRFMHLCTFLLRRAGHLRNAIAMEEDPV
jgi:hypothetical protein